MADQVVNRFAQEAAPSGEPIANRFAQPEIDFSRLGEFDARNASEGQKWRLALGYLTTPSEKARGDIIRKVLPGAAIQADPNNGRLVVSYKGETGYIDKPGVTVGGILDTIAQAAKYLPAGKLATMGGSLAARTLLAGAGAAATSVAEDVAAIPQGSEQGISPEKAAITGAAAAIAQPVSELVVAPALGWLSQKGRAAWQAIRGTPQAVTAQGTLTDVGRKLAEQAGLDPDQLTPQLAQELESAARQATAAAVPEEQLPTATTRQALSQRFKVPLTKGEITDDYAQQSLEENLRRMDVTTRAGTIMRGAEKQSAAALRGESGESGFGLLRREMGGAAADVADAGQQVVAATQAEGVAAKGAYRAAYQTAREAGAALDARNYKEFIASTENVLKESLDYDEALYPKTAQMLERLRKQGVFFEEMGREAPRKLPLAKLENTRKLINALWKSADETDRMGLNVLRSQFDEMVNGALDSGRVVGSKDAVQSWKLGRSLYQRFSELFRPGAETGRAEQSAGRAVADWLKSDNVTGEEAIRAAVNNKALTERILQINGTDSPAHLALKQGTLEYVFRPALKGEEISPRLIVSQYDRYFRGASKEQMQAIFDSEDRKVIAEFVQLAKAKIPQRGVENFSNTGNVLVKGAQQLLQKLGIISAATGHPAVAAATTGANLAGRAVSANQARTAVRGLVPTNRLSAPTVAIVSGAASENQQ